MNATPGILAPGVVAAGCFVSANVLTVFSADRRRHREHMWMQWKVSR
jgi:hypothetical protein